MTKKYLVDELFEDKDVDQKIIKSFQVKNELSTDIFHKEGNSYSMIESVKNKLLDVANTFLDYIGVDFFVYDVVLTGSLANYNWSDYSDVDLHILMDYNEISSDGSNQSRYKSIIQEFFNSKKDNWNRNHDIKIKNYDVEIYIQDTNEPHISAGVYSVLNNKWITEPTASKDGIDEELILSKGEEYAKIIEDLISKTNNGEDISAEIDDVKQKIKQFRQSGLERGGEYSYENLTFKLLRRNGYIEKLINIKRKLTDKKLSVTEKRIK